MSRAAANYTQLHVVDGRTPGPDGLPLSPFARFAERIMRGGHVRDEDCVAEQPRRLTDGAKTLAELPAGASSLLLADGRILVAHPERGTYRINRDGSVDVLGGGA